MSAAEPTAPKQHSAEYGELLRDIVEEMDQRGHRQEQPSTLSGLTLRHAEEAIQAVHALQEASIRLTYPEDWVLFRGKDGAEVCFLQDCGCERIRGLWGIDFDRVSLKNDVVDRELDDGNFIAEVIVRGRSSLTGETLEEMGFRSSLGFFGKDWEKATENSNRVEIERLKANIRKAALVNGRGRCVRTIGGLAQVPVSRLREILGNEPVKRIRNADIQSGTRGGSGAGSVASDPQINRICGEALKQGKVAGLDKTMDWNGLREKLAEAKLSGGRGGTASKMIDRLANLEKGGMTIAEFEEALGISIVEEGAE